MVESLTIERVKGLLRLPTCPMKNLKGHLEIINGGKGSFIARDKPLLLYVVEEGDIHKIILVKQLNYFRGTK